MLLSAKVRKNRRKAKEICVFLLLRQIIISIFAPSKPIKYEKILIINGNDVIHYNRFCTEDTCALLFRNRYNKDCGTRLVPTINSRLALLRQ